MFAPADYGVLKKGGLFAIFIIIKKRKISSSKLPLNHDPKPSTSTSTTSTLTGGRCIRQQLKGSVRGLVKEWLHPPQADLAARQQVVPAERIQ